MSKSPAAKLADILVRQIVDDLLTLDRKQLSESSANSTGLPNGVSKDRDWFNAKLEIERDFDDWLSMKGIYSSRQTSLLQERRIRLK